MDFGRTFDREIILYGRFLLVYRFDRNLAVASARYFAETRRFYLNARSLRSRVSRSEKTRRTDKKRRNFIKLLLNSDSLKDSTEH